MHGRGGKNSAWLVASGGWEHREVGGVQRSVFSQSEDGIAKGGKVKGAKIGSGQWSEFGRQKSETES